MSFDFISAELYGVFYFYAMMLVVLYCFFELNSGFKATSLGGLLVIIIIIYIGFRPLSGRYFGDMRTYYNIFESYQKGQFVRLEKDIVFNLFMKWCSGFMNVHFFFLTCAILYIYPLYVVCKKWFLTYWFYAFVVLITTFSFWAYGTNGIRNGIAGSIFLLGMSRDKRSWQIALFIVAISFHKTMLLPAAGFLVAQVYNKPKHLIYFWVLCIPLSLIGGAFWENLFANLGFEDDRLSYLVDVDANAEQFSSTGFRWDFLAYSGTAIFVGWYFIIKKNFSDKIYFWIFNTYVFTNAIWILVIRANFSNRFAYLSWFIMGFVVAYPFLRGFVIPNQARWFARVILVYFLFTYLMNVLLVG